MSGMYARADCAQCGGRNLQAPTATRGATVIPLCNAGALMTPSVSSVSCGTKEGWCAPLLLWLLTQQQKVAFFVPSCRQC